MNTKHTPGPWEVNGKLVVKDCYSGVICDTEVSIDYHHKRYVQLAECKANARLIAAAPDLLASLQNLLNEVLMTEQGLNATSPLAREHAKKAIAKAEGRK